VLCTHLHGNSPRIRVVITAHHKDAVATGAIASCDIP
jgi:hypothetical protein